MSKVVLVILYVMLGYMLFSICMASGCTWYQRVTDAVFNKPEPTTIVTPETSKGQLWQTIKGLTPNWLAIPVIALGAVAMFNGAMKLGMSCIIFGSVNLFMALATSRFGFWMALCGLVGSIAAVAASILVKNKALKDIVFGAQKLKNLAADRDGANNILAEQQVKSTKKIVQKIKSKAKLKGVI